MKFLKTSADWAEVFFVIINFLCDLYNKERQPFDCLKFNYCKHVSRILWSARRRMVIIYLVVALLQQSCCLPFPLFRKSGNVNEQLTMPYDIRDLRGIAVHKVYP